MQSHRTKSGKSCFVEWNLAGIGIALRYARSQEPRDASDLGVNGEACSGTSHAIARPQIRDAFTDSDDCACTTIARTLRLIETAANRLNRRENSIALYFADDFAHQIGPRLSLLNKALPRKLSRRALGPGRHHRGCNAHQHAAGKKLWRRNFLHCDLAAACVLENLFQ